MAIVLTVSGISFGTLYQTAFEQKRMDLIQTAQSQARLMEAVARFDSRFSEFDHPEGAAAATLSQIREAHENYEGFGDTGEFTLARREGDMIVFVLRHRHHDIDTPRPLPFAGKLAEPMRRAVSGLSGTVVGLDYRGVEVLAAYEPVSVLNLGLVAKINLTEVREPFVSTGLGVGAVAVVLVVLGTVLFFRVTDPMFRQLQEREEQYRNLSQQLERRVAERTAELEAANEELEGFAHSIAHDVRAPLRAMDGFSQALLEECGDELGAEGRSYAERVRAGSQRMALLLDDLLKLAQVARGELGRREVDLSGLARKAAAVLQRTAPEREVAFDIAPGIVANGDERLLEVVIANLLDNAWKFTSNHPQAKIEFGVTNQKEKPAYYVRDDGAGFDMDYAEKLFQPCQRLHGRDEFPGTGIGLATVRRIVERHGGEAWITAGVEQGATVCFTLSTPVEA